MLRKNIHLIFYCLISFSSSQAYSQNLVPNHSFEIFDSTNIYQWYMDPGFPLNDYCQGWFDTPNCPGIPFVMCSSLPAPFSVPANGLGFSYAIDGTSYLAVTAFPKTTISDDLNETRVVANIKLTNPLIGGENYEISFYHKLATHELADTIDIMGVDNLGVLLTKDTASCEDIKTIRPNARTKPGIINRNPEWEKFTGNFIADGGETFLAIGCIGPRSEIKDDYKGGLYSSVYFIDSLSLVQKDIPPIEIYWDLSPTIFTPNGDNLNDFYTINSSGFAYIQIKVVNRWGNIVRTYNELQESWDGTNEAGEEVSDGVYFLSINGIDLLGNDWNDYIMVTVIR